MFAGGGTERARVTIERQTKSADEVDLQTRIAQRAYQIFQDRGGDAGRDVEDWLQAEQEILSERMGSDFK